MRSVTMYMYSWSWNANRRRHKKGWSSCSRMVLSRMILRTASIRIHSSLLIYFNAYNWRDSRCSTIRTYSNLKSLELMKPIIQRIIWSFVTFPNAPRPTIRISLNWDRFTRKGGVYMSSLTFLFDMQLSPFTFVITVSLTSTSWAKGSCNEVWKETNFECREEMKRPRSWFRSGYLCCFNSDSQTPPPPSRSSSSASSVYNSLSPPCWLATHDLVFDNVFACTLHVNHLLFLVFVKLPLSIAVVGLNARNRNYATWQTMKRLLQHMQLNVVTCKSSYIHHCSRMILWLYYKQGWKKQPNLILLMHMVCFITQMIFFQLTTKLTFLEMRQHGGKMYIASDKLIKAEV